MATQSLYRRYRPRRFSELKGQDHIVRALRTSVAEGREGQAYLFSGPRGTGKTTTARIMAKVLNCENAEGGEPCCECASCLSVERGTSYDVHELDAASNNGVDAMRDLIERASLGTPGRHKVYILDEVHMLSKGAEAALLKTLEEPPPHVVFVLATTDPQKMSDTIRSRTQHLQFHLLGPDTLQEHVRWVAADAGLSVTDDAIEQVIAQGAGSPRDTLSALELVSNAGGAATEVIALDDFVEAMIDHDPGRGLTMVAHAVSRGRDPRTITEELIGFLRNGFLALMAPDLVQLPSQRLDALTDLARRAGAAGLVRAIELLGEALTEMRHAPDPRVLLDVVTVQLTCEEVGDDAGALVSRIERLERQLGNGASAAATPAAASTDEPAAEPVRDVPAPAVPAPARGKLGSRAATTTPDPVDESPAPAGALARDASAEPALDEPRAPEPAPSGGQVTAADWETVRPQLRGMARAVYSPATLVSAATGTVTLRLPNDTHRSKCEQHRSVVEQALAAHVGQAVAVELVVDDGGASGPSDRVAGGSSSQAPVVPTNEPPPTPAPRRDEPATSMSEGALAHDIASPAVPAPDSDTAHLSVVPTPDPEPVANGRAIAEQARTQGPVPDPEAGLQTLAESLPDDDEVDLDDLIDAPPDTVKTPVDRLAEAFPGSELVDDLS